MIGGVFGSSSGVFAPLPRTLVVNQADGDDAAAQRGSARKFRTLKGAAAAADFNDHIVVEWGRFTETDDQFIGPWNFTFEKGASLVTNTSNYAGSGQTLQTYLNTTWNDPDVWLAGVDRAYDFTNFANISVNADGTGAVTGTTDLVRRATNLKANSNHAVWQGHGTGTPFFPVLNGTWNGRALYALRNGDGTGGSRLLVPVSNTTTYTLIMGIRRVTQTYGGGATVWASDGSPNNTFFFVESASEIRFTDDTFGSQNTLPGVTNTLGWNVYTVRANAGASTLWTANSAVATAAGRTVLALGSNVRIGTRDFTTGQADYSRAVYSAAVMADHLRNAWQNWIRAGSGLKW